MPLAALSLLLLTRLTYAIEPGWTLSISASPTDPAVNVTGATGGPLELYLWVTCAADLAALQASVSGSLDPVGFTPLNGVLNAGTSTDLLLAVPGCAAATPYVLGKWFVIDAGGSFCLGAVDTLLGVPCDDATALENVEVFGFSSDGSAPCHVGTDYCDTAGGPIRVGVQPWGAIKAQFQQPEEADRP